MSEHNETESGLAPLPVSDAGRPTLPGAMPAWRLYLVAVASFCIYLPFWIYRTARQYGIGVRYRRTPLWWALGCVAAPLTACVLYEFNRRATAVTGGRRWSAFPALLYIGVVILWAFTPLAGYVVTFFVLAPLPFVLVQRNINRAAAVGGALVARPKPGVRALYWVTVAAGIPLLALIAWYQDLPTARAEFAQRVATGASVSGNSGSYEITIPSQQWRRATPGTIGDAESDLELIGPGFETWIVAYAEPIDEADLETSVSNRRQLIFDSGEPKRYDEVRYFLEGSDLVLASEATIDVSFGIAGSVRYIVLTVALKRHLVELVGYTAEPEIHTEELLDLVHSFAEFHEARES